MCTTQRPSSPCILTEYGPIDNGGALRKETFPSPWLLASPLVSPLHLQLNLARAFRRFLLHPSEWRGAVVVAAGAPAATASEREKQTFAAFAATCQSQKLGNLTPQQARSLLEYLCSIGWIGQGINEAVIGKMQLLTGLHPKRLVHFVEPL